MVLIVMEINKPTQTQNLVSTCPWKSGIEYKVRIIPWDMYKKTRINKTIWNNLINPYFLVNAGKTNICEHSVTTPEKASAEPISFGEKPRPPLSLLLAV